MRKSINVDDYLFILKNDDIETRNELLSDLWLRKDGILNVSWSDDCDFSNEEVKVIRNFKDKIRYLFASYHEDTMIINLIKKIVPEIKDVELPASRYAKGFNMQEWQKEYGFTLEEFLTNRKYIVVSDAYRSVEKIIGLGLFNWDNIAKSSLI